MFVADLHNDLVQRIMEGEDVTKQTLNGHTDIPRLKESCINLQILIIWVSSKSSNPNFFKKANRMYDEIEKLSIIKDVQIPKNLEEIKDGITNNSFFYLFQWKGERQLKTI